MKNFFTILVISTALALVACKGGSDRRASRDRYPDGPVIEDNLPEGMTVDFRSTSDRSVIENPPDTFVIPRCGQGKLGYVTTRWQAPLSGVAMRLEYTIKASADAQIVGHEQRDQQGRMHLHFQRKGDKETQSYLSAGYRQWSTAYVMLENGSVSFEVALIPSLWGNRNGFAAAMADVENVGFTLGDNQAKGHGVCMKAGTASLTINSFTVK